MQPRTPSVSIIMPVKNALPYLDECLNSIAAQSLEDWELICVDGGSTDGSSQKLDKFVSTEPRASVVHRICDDAGAARNLGLSMARGEYVAFLDADDFFEAPMLKESLAKARKNHADVVIFGGRYFDDQTQALSNKLQFVNAKLTEKECFNRNDLPRNLFETAHPAPWGKLMRRDFIIAHNLEFQQLTSAEDLSFSLSALAFADRVVAFEGDFVRRRTPASSSTGSLEGNQPLPFLDALLNLKRRLGDAGLYEQLRDTYNGQVLITTRYSLEAAATDSARWTIIDTLTRPPFADLDLLFHDRNWYSSAYASDCARYLEAALRQQKTLLIEAEGFAPTGTFTCITPRRTLEPPVISTIIPIFNTGHLIRETLDSICSQDIANLEIICIDDGSTDDTLDVLSNYAKSEPRLSVYHQDNRGPGSARNIGQLVAQGTYLSFVDSDDLLAKHTYQICLDRLEQEDLDMVIFDAQSFYGSTDLQETHPDFLSYYTRNLEYAEPCSGPDMMSAMVTGNDYKPATCLYMVKRQLLADNRIYTHPGIIHEDNGFTFSILCYAQRVAHIRQPFYLRRVREHSIMTTEKSFANVYGYYMSSLDMLNDIYKSGLIDNPEAAINALQLVFRVQHNARRDYSDIAECEMGALKAIPAAAAKTLTTAMDASHVSRRAKNLMAKQEREAEAAMRRITSGRSYKLAQILASPMHHIRGDREGARG